MKLNFLYVILVSLSFITLVSCNKYKGKRIRFAEVIDINNIDHQSASVRVKFDIKEKENASVGLRWTEKSTQTRSYEIEIFTFNDTTITFEIGRLYSDLTYTVEPFINSYQGGSHISEIYEPVNFHTKKTPSTPCFTEINKISMDGMIYTASSLYNQSYKYYYIVSFDIGSNDIDFIFEEEPYSGVFKTTKSVEDFGPKEVRVEMEIGWDKYKCVEGTEIYFSRDDQYNITNSNISISFCDLVLTRFDTFVPDTLIISGEASSL